MQAFRSLRTPPGRGVTPVHLHIGSLYTTFADELRPLGRGEEEPVWSLSEFTIADDQLVKAPAARLMIFRWPSVGVKASRINRSLKG